MMRHTLRVFLVIAFPVFLFSQELGKIAGTVTDAATGERLAGANVLVEGTSLGAATDIQGNYVIVGVPGGVYTVRCEYIGYRAVRLTNVRVSAGLTTDADFASSSEALELGVVTVVAERPLIQKDATSTITIVTAEDLETIPVRGIQDVIALLPGVIVQDGNVHIRGGRADEVGYTLNGASMNNALTNANAIYVSQDAVEEIKVLAGGYTAEHGGANAGIVAIELKTGTTELRYMFDFQTDKFADYEKGEQFLNTYSYGHQIGSFNVGGPLLSEKIRFFVAGEQFKQADRIGRFSEAFEFVDKIDDNTSQSVYDTVDIKYPAGFTPKNSGSRLNLNGTLLFDFSPLKLRLSTTYNNRRNYLDSTPMLSVLNGRERYDDVNSLLSTAKLTYFLTPKTYLDFNAYLFDYKLERGDSYFDHDWTKWYDSTAVSNHTASSGDTVTYRNAWQPDYNYRLNGFFFDRNGAVNDFYRVIDQKYIGGAANFVSQIGVHEMKLGVDMKRYTLRYFDIAPSAMIHAADPSADVTGYTHYGDPTTTGPDMEQVPVGQWLTFAGVEAYGYDLYGNEIDERKVYDLGNDTFDSKTWSGDIESGQPIYADAPKHPVFFAGYLQDKIEFNDLIVNIGVRFDYFDSDDRFLSSPDSVMVDEVSAMILDNQWEDVKPFTEISPRIGFSFPVTDKTVFYLGYGKFVQLTELNNIYWNAYEQSRQIYQGGFYYGGSPVGFGIEPIRTTSYEVGFRQQISPSSAFDVTGFYRNVKGLTHVVKEVINPESDLREDYMRRVNGDFATTKGLEFRLTLRRTKRLSAMVNYTLTDAEGTGSATTAYVAAIYRDSEAPKVVNPLDYSQRHRGAIMLNYQFGKGDGGPLLEQLGAYLVFTFSSGHPYTFVYAPAGGQISAYDAGVDYMLDTRSRQALEPIGASTTPWTFNMDLRLDKTISVAGLDITLYTRITNLFNRKNPINVYQRTGSAYDDGYLSDPAYSGGFINSYGGDEYVALYEALNEVNSQAYWSQIGQQLFGQPRQILFGIRLSR